MPGRNSNLSPFLDQCNIAANYLLSVYRDANKAAREDEPPAYFQEKFAFEEFASPVADDDRRARAEEQARDVSNMVEASVKEIFDVFHHAVQDHYEIDELEGNYVERVKKHAPVASLKTRPEQPTDDVDQKKGS